LTLNTKRNLANSKRSQSAIEFAVMIGFLLFAFITFVAIINNNLSDRYREKEDAAVKDIAYAIQDEINIASTTTDGYLRNFTIPNKIGTKDYERLKISQGLVQVATDKSSIVLPIPEVSSNSHIQTGINNISKVNGEVCVNEC
jgi:poly(3-hydroxyalkanoate) synthetase